MVLKARGRSCFSLVFRSLNDLAFRPPPTNTHPGIPPLDLKAGFSVNLIMWDLMVVDSWERLMGLQKEVIWILQGRSFSTVGKEGGHHECSLDRWGNHGNLTLALASALPLEWEKVYVCPHTHTLSNSYWVSSLLHHPTLSAFPILTFLRAYQFAPASSPLLALSYLPCLLHPHFHFCFCFYLSLPHQLSCLSYCLSPQYPAVAWPLLKGWYHLNVSPPPPVMSGSWGFLHMCTSLLSAMASEQ